MRIRIGTRGSALARAQTGHVADALTALGATVETVVVRTTGDVVTGPLTPDVGQGVFTAQLERALLAGEVDLAVHSLKDLPTALAEGLVLAAIPPREDHRDALVSPHADTLQGLPAGSRVGTSAVRRQALLLRHFPDLCPVPLRGNVDTRLAKLDAGELDAIVVAAAGLARLGRELGAPIPPQVMLPAPAQGALGLQTAAGGEIRAFVAQLDHGPTRLACAAERALLAGLHAGCQVPLGAQCVVSADGATLTLSAIVLATDGSEVVEAEQSGAASDPEGLGARLATTLLAAGADRLLPDR